MDNHQVLQALVIQILLMFKLVYFVSHTPYRTFDEGLSDCLNDMFLVFLHGLQFTISPYVAQDSTRYQFGSFYNF